MSCPRRVLHFALLVALALGHGGCVSIQPASARTNPSVTPAIFCDRLYFGRAIPGGGEVTDAQWAAFVAAEIAPRFPDGFTTYRATGHWRGDDGTAVNEPTFVLEIIHAATPGLDRAMDEIARAYRVRFEQDAVMRVRAPAEQTFLRR